MGWAALGLRRPVHLLPHGPLEGWDDAFYVAQLTSLRADRDLLLQNDLLAVSRIRPAGAGARSSWSRTRARCRTRSASGPRWPTLLPPTRGRCWRPRGRWVPRGLRRLPGPGVDGLPGLHRARRRARCCGVSARRRDGQPGRRAGGRGGAARSLRHACVPRITSAYRALRSRVPAGLPGLAGGRPVARRAPDRSQLAGSCS